MADAGLAGLPNAGKSSLLRRLSNAKPKVADYPFTTLEPMLGVVDWTGEGDVFTLADVPGLLEGASEGVGLGHEFLAHLERCQLLLHVVDITGYYGVEPLEGFRTILAELDAHAAGLAGKPQVIVLNKIDAIPVETVREWEEVFIGEVDRLRNEGHPAFAYEVDGELPAARLLVRPVSAVTGAGLSALLTWVGPSGTTADGSRRVARRPGPKRQRLWAGPWRSTRKDATSPTARSPPASAALS